MAGSLSHLRVLDLSRVLAGPYAGQILGDLGADVIKIERPGSGDETRAWGPPYLAGRDGQASSESAYFLSANRNKRSVAIDFSRAEGQRLVRDLAGKSDVLIENFRVGGLRQYGLDYASLNEFNPRLVYCSISGFGQTGPYADRPGYDFMIQAMGGLMSITGRAEGEPGAGSLKVGVAVTDVMAGLYAVIAILSALAAREKSGRGQHIDLALLDVQIAGLANQAMNYLTTGESPRRMGNVHPSIVPYQDFPTCDHRIAVAVGNDSQFERLCAVLGHSEWKEDERFRTNSQRVANRKDLIALMNGVLVKRPASEWISSLTDAGVPCGPINDLNMVFHDPQVEARHMRVEMEHPLAEKLPLVASPIRIPETPVEYRIAPPLLGQHTGEVLSDLLGLSQEQISDLAASGAVGLRSSR
jgi:crotonobetainyl-CoA:carnitine CoA-transferase CaiB-like acyl-CoA transferase